MRNFLVPTFTQIATFATIIVIFTNSVLFEREVTCTCKNRTRDCAVYITVPVFIIICLVLWRDKDSFSTSRYLCTKWQSCCSCGCFWTILHHGLKAFVIGLLWVVAVLMDGDWFACCANGLSGEQSQIPCKANRTSEEQVIVDDLKNLSKVIGMSILLVLVFVVCIVFLVTSSECCRDVLARYRNITCCQDTPCCFNENDHYEVVLVKEKQYLLNEIFKERAKAALERQQGD